MFTLLGEQKDIADSPSAKPLALTKAEIRFDDVSFGYDKSVPILRHVSFTVAQGSKVAIVGPSGAGHLPHLTVIPFLSLSSLSHPPLPCSHHCSAVRSVAPVCLPLLL